MARNTRIEERVHTDNLGPQATRVLGVDYTHLTDDAGGDLYVTKYGVPAIENLRPENFLTDKSWFNKNSVQLSGTSSLYKVRTKEINGRYKDVVIKWNRMGQDIPGAEDDEQFANAEFNSPFEEFSLVMELRDTGGGPTGRIITQRPLAIYVAPGRVEPSRVGRKEYKMHAKIQMHKEIKLDMFRLYAVIYEWIKGIDAVQALKKGLLERKYVESLTLRSRDQLQARGFAVRDNKPHHIIVRPKEDGDPAGTENEESLYGLVDFELLERTPERQQRVKKTKRLSYLEMQRDRFLPRDPGNFPAHLKQTSILDVNYVYGRVESTGGALWVVGNDADLFDYFLPERWEKTPRTKLSIVNEIYHTLTKDNINLVLKVSNVGMRPDMDPFKEEEEKILKYGYNSPFEEVSLAMYLSSRNIATTYPRSIYMTGNKSEISSSLLDPGRFESHKDYMTPDGTPVLRTDRDYVIIWGYWNGPDEKLAAEDAGYYEAIDALRAYREEIIDEDEYVTLMRVTRQRLSEVGIEDLNLRGNHLLFSLDSSGSLVMDDRGKPEVRICSFELLRRSF